jgi:LuxR family quorum-sensing system transcriptional regulator CciR
MVASLCLRVASALSSDLFDRGRIRPLFFSDGQRLEDLDVDWLCSLGLAAENLDHVATLLRMVMEGVGATACVLCQVGHTRPKSVFEIQIDCPQELVQALKSRKVSDDAIMVACEQRVLGFQWSDLHRVIEMNDRRRDTLALYAAHGLEDGYTVPLCVPGEPRGFCSFGYADASNLSFQQMAIMQVTAPLLFETARRVQGLWREHRMPLGLSQRQTECVSLVARGLSDAQIAWKMGISIDTVHDHIEEAKRRYGAKKRVDLVVKAIRSGDVHWNRITE